ncbi:Inner membrane protein yciS [Haemophilus influenzae]|nr:Inner membrane protein yciS [Haemophilus influenzae]
MIKKFILGYKYFKGNEMIKYILGIVIFIAIVLVAITIGANNDQIITFNYIVAESQFQLSSLVAILFGLGLILGWLITAFFYIKLKLKNMALARQVKRQTLQINELTTTRDKVV